MGRVRERSNAGKRKVHRNRRVLHDIAGVLKKKLKKFKAYTEKA